MLSFEQLQSLVAHATKPMGGRFYRNFYRMHSSDPALQIQSIEEWHALPTVTKDDLISCPLKERSFIPLSEIDHLRVSSGTSGKPPLFSPRTNMRNMEFRQEYHDFKSALLAFPVPIMPHWHEKYQESLGLPGRVIVYDPKNPAVSVRLARVAGVDAISLFIYQIQPAGEHMKREGMNGRIRFIEFTGENCSVLLYEYMRATFPNAIIVQRYGSSEIEDTPQGILCKPINGSEPLSVYHPKQTHYLEIFDPETKKIVEPKSGVEGELLITAYQGEPSAFPLLRFQVGDSIRVIEEKCPHGSWSFTVLGRTNMDFVKVLGGVLRADEIGRVLRLFPDKVSDLFELHCYIKETPHGPLLFPVLHVETRRNPDLEILAHDVEKNLRTGPAFTYAQGVAEGRYLPLSCVLLERNSPAKKHRRIVQH